MSLSWEDCIRMGLREHKISRADAIVQLIDVGYNAEDAENIVNEWIDGWEYQKDWSEEHDHGWSA